MSKYLNYVALATLLAATCLALPSLAQVAPSTDQQLARAISDLSSNACYGIAAGTIAFPTGPSPEDLSRAIEKMGLTFGINAKILDDLGALGGTLVSQSAMGSKSLDHGDVVLAFGGQQPGCRVILLAEAAVNVADAVGADLTKLGWKAVPAMTAQRGTLERRAFIKRDAQGNPYLMNLMIMGEPSSKLRLFTTTVRVPAGVVLPPGF